MSNAKALVAVSLVMLVGGCGLMPEREGVARVSPGHTASPGCEANRNLCRVYVTVEKDPTAASATGWKIYVYPEVLKTSTRNNRPAQIVWIALNDDVVFLPEGITPKQEADLPDFDQGYTTDDDDGQPVTGSKPRNFHWLLKPRPGVGSRDYEYAIAVRKGATTVRIDPLISNLN